MKISKNLFNVWAVFHIGFIICICCYSAYDKYCRFYQLPENRLVKGANKALFVNTPMLFYGKFTGTNTGYGFFAPNVKPGGIILGDCDGGKIGPVFKNFESMMRFSVLATRITDYLTNPADTGSVNDKLLEDKYYGLVFKSIAVKIYNQNQCEKDTVYLSYNIFDFPTLDAYRHGKRDYSLRKIKEVQLVRQSK